MDRHKINRICVELITTVTELAETCEIVDLSAHKQITDKLKEICAEVAAEPKTNGDRIRQMSGEELAAFIDIYDLEDICNTRCAVLNYQDCMAGKKCKGNILAWLKQEAEAENNKAN